MKALYAYRRAHAPATYREVQAEELPEPQRPTFRSCLENSKGLPDISRYALATAYDADVEDAVNVGCYENVLAIEQGITSQLWAEEPDLSTMGTDVERIRDLMRKRARLAEATTRPENSARSERPGLSPASATIRFLSESCQRSFQEHNWDEKNAAQIQVLLNDSAADLANVVCNGTVQAVESGILSATEIFTQNKADGKVDEGIIQAKVLYAYKRSEGQPTYRIVLPDQDLRGNTALMFKRCMLIAASYKEASRYLVAAIFDADVKDAANVICNVQMTAAKARFRLDDLWGHRQLEAVDELRRLMARRQDLARAPT